MIAITVTGAERIIKLLESMNRPGFKQFFSEQFYRERVKPELEKYPAPRRAKMRFVSDKQRRFFFAALGRGTIQIPYQRTNRLKTGWVFIPDGAGGRITNRTLYAQYVVGVPGQAAIHQGWWRTEEQILQDAVKNRIDLFVDQTMGRWFDRSGVQ
jgi:hypothetical protein